MDASVPSDSDAKSCCCCMHHSFKMARSRSWSRDRSHRRKYSSSDDSDYDRRKRRTKKKKRNSRSRSRSTDSERRRYKSKESRHRSSYDDRPSRSSRSERRDTPRSHRRDRSRSRSPNSKTRREKEVRRKEKSDTREITEKGESSRNVKEEKGQGDGGLSFKERVARLVISSGHDGVAQSIKDEPECKIDDEKVAEIDSQDFHQQSFVSNAYDKDTSDGKGSCKQTETADKGEDHSHEDAIFGLSSSTSISAPSFPNGSSSHDSHDEIFGPRLLVDQNVRNQKWLNKLQQLRQKILKESA